MPTTLSPPVPLTRVVAYLRKSRDDGEESVEQVLAKHERILQDYALSAWGAPLPESRLMREVASGETISARPVMQALVGMIQRKEVDAVLVVELQRLSRGDLVDVGELSRLFYYTKCKILTPARAWDLSDEFDRKFFEMELMHGRDYLEYTKRIMGRGRERSAMEGNYLGSRRPFGYERVVIDKHPTLAIVPEEAEIVRMIFELYAGEEHLGPHLIADRLNDLGLKSLRMDHWTPQAVRNIVQSPLYVGKIHWGRRKTVKEFRDGEIVSTNPVADDYILVDGRHEPIISRELWERAEAASKTRAHPSARHDRSRIVNPLAGLLVCASCGKMMSYKLCYDKKHRPLAPIFQCTSRGCETRGANVSDVLATLADALRRSLSDLQADGADSSPAYDPDDQARKLLERELEEFSRQKERLYDFLERGLYDEEVFRSRMGALLEKIKASESALQTLESRKKTAEERQQFASTLTRCIDILAVPSASAEATNRLLKQILRRIEYSRQRSPRRAWDPTPIELQLFFL